MPTIQKIPRTAVRVGLAAGRLPLTAVEAVAGKRRHDEWPPALLFETVGSEVEQVVGALLRDDVLVEEGRLRRAKVARLREADRLEAEAEQRRIEADEEHSRRRSQTQQERTQAKTTAKARKAQIARDEAAARREVEAETTAKRTRAKASERQKERKDERTARRLRAEAVGAEEQALAEEKAATARARDAESADVRRRATRAARRSAS